MAGKDDYLIDTLIDMGAVDPAQVDADIASSRPEYVFLVAGESGGIGANQQYPARLMLDNLTVACNVISSAHRYGVKKLLHLASSDGKLCSRGELLQEVWELPHHFLSQKLTTLATWHTVGVPGSV